MKDRFLNTFNQKDRLFKEWLQYGSLIVAFDYDDTIFDYHNRGDTYQTVINQIKTLGHMGCTMICFTSCDESRYSDIKKFLYDNNIPCHGINIDSEKVPFKGRKIYYNVFYDDRAGIGQIVDVINLLIRDIEDYIYKDIKDYTKVGTHCHYSGKSFNNGEWLFNNKFPAAYNKFRKVNDIIPNIEDIMNLFKR